MKYIKIITTYMQGIAKMHDNYNVISCGLYTRITDVIYSVWYNNDEIKIYDYTTHQTGPFCINNREDMILDACVVKKIDETSRKEYNNIIKELKERRIIKRVEQPKEPYVVDIERSTNTLIKVVPRPGFEVGLKKCHEWVYFKTLGAAYPMARWLTFTNDPYEIKVDTRRYRPGYKFVPEESTIEKSVYKIVWPRKRDFKKGNMVYR